jgi:MFS family permease
MIVDEMTTRDVRASAQGLFNLVLVGVGTIVGNLLTGYIGGMATRPDGTVDFRFLFSVPMWITVACLIGLILMYPSRSRIVDQEGLAAA